MTGSLVVKRHQTTHWPKRRKRQNSSWNVKRFFSCGQQLRRTHIHPTMNFFLRNSSWKTVTRKTVKDLRCRHKNHVSAAQSIPDIYGDLTQYWVDQKLLRSLFSGKGYKLWTLDLYILAVLFWELWTNWLGMDVNGWNTNLMDWNLTFLLWVFFWVSAGIPFMLNIHLFFSKSTESAMLLLVPRIQISQCWKHLNGFDHFILPRLCF